MEHGFPPGATVEDVRTVWLMHHCIMLGLVTVAAGTHFLPKRRLSRPETLWLWSVILTLSPVVTALTWVGLSTQWVSLGGSPIRDTTLAAYVLVCWLIGFIGSVRTVRQCRQKNERSRMVAFHGYGNMLCPIVSLYVAAICVPVPSVSGERPPRSVCRYNLRQIGHAAKSSLDMNHEFPRPTSGNPMTSWRIQLLPHLNRGYEIGNYDQKLPWNSEMNLQVSKSQLSSVTCPTANGFKRTDDQGRYFTHFSMLTGPGTFSSNFKPRTPLGISDGAANTIAFVEAAGLKIIWTEPRDAKVGREALGINLTCTGKYDSPGIMSGWHTGGAHATFADGSTRFLNQDIDPAVLKALTTVNGGETLPESH